MKKKSVVAIYTDGGCSGNPGPGGWAFVITRTDAKKLAEEAGTGRTRRKKIVVEEALADDDITDSGAEEDTTNNRMELTAVLNALSCAEKNGIGASGEKIEVYTDSQYVQKGITEWIIGWKKKNWKNWEHQPVKNQDLWKELDVLNEKLSPEWFWVKGHAGNKYNEICDALTRRALDAL